MERIVITGGTGMVGQALTRALLGRGYDITILTRRPGGNRIPGVAYAAWDPGAFTVDRDVIAGCDHIIHLAGAGVADRRWSRKRKKEILGSRVKGGELIVKSLRETGNRVRTVIGASAIGWYGPDLNTSQARPFVETDPCFDDFLGNTCSAWENSIKEAGNLGKRIVLFRTGIILSRAGGALQRFRIPLGFGFTPIFGRGSQVISWIHLDDLVDLYIRAIEN